MLNCLGNGCTRQWLPRQVPTFRSPVSARREEHLELSCEVLELSSELWIWILESPPTSLGDGMDGLAEWNGMGIVDYGRRLWSL